MMICLLTAIGLSPDGSSTVHIYTHTIHRMIQNKQYVEQRNNFGRVRAMPRLGWKASHSSNFLVMLVMCSVMLTQHSLTCFASAH